MTSYGLKEFPELYAIGFDYAAERVVAVRLQDLVTLNRKAFYERKPPFQFAILGISDSVESVDLTGQIS